MRDRSIENQLSESVCLKLKPAFEALFEAFVYASDTASERWEFAVPIRRFQQLGFGETDLRWLARKGYVEHAREVTLEGDDGRAFRSTGDLTFHKRTCFVLTDTGVAKARLVVSNHQSISLHEQLFSDSTNGHANGPTPVWDPETRELSFNGSCIKQFKWKAVNQELILSAFQEDDWPPVIFDPLPPKPETCPKRRLHDTIKALNGHHERDIIRFHGNGTGDGIRWEFIKGDETIL